MSHQAPVPEAPVMSTLNDDGTRRWMYPRCSPGRHWRLRRWLAYALVAVFTAIPYLHVNGKPMVLLDIPAREFTILGFTFLPTDTLLLALFLVALVLSVFLVTALLGRVWCGWMCPQTVYLEFVYRPLERLFDGPPGARHRPGRKSTPLRTMLKYTCYLIISVYLAHTFLAYFVGVDVLVTWLRRSPLEHPSAFLLMVGTTGLMMFDFSYFREQTCVVACPYGRFQSVLLDRHSLIVGYDQARGEPRGKGRRTDGDTRGDCIECGQCTDTCPTGIDIRNGLQMECIACTQCVDACDNVMDRIGKPRGLIALRSQASLESEPARLWRPRVLVYPAAIGVFLTAFVLVMANKQPADVTLLRGLGRVFYELEPGTIANQLRIKIHNRSDQDAAYRITVESDGSADLETSENPVAIAAGKTRTQPVTIILPRSAFQNGRYDLCLRIYDAAGFDRTYSYRLLGPRN